MTPVSTGPGAGPTLPQQPAMLLQPLNLSAASSGRLVATPMWGRPCSVPVTGRNEVGGEISRPWDTCYVLISESVLVLGG